MIFPLSLIHIFDKGDGLHFNAAAGEAILTYIRTHALPDWE